MTDEFERCWPWLEASLNEFGATHTKDQIRDAIRHGAVLWPGENAVILTTMVHLSDRGALLHVSGCRAASSKNSRPCIP